MQLIRRNYQIAATLFVGCLVLLLLGLGQSASAQWLASTFAAAAAVQRGLA
ncbi:hypothetical protein [Arthrobacter sp. A2-55]|uniref:hypothetical protein n=1 Tax=Arthrobacter sp. A2-55 TaxID=2897337 RepID=UPI00292EB87B|nr:hypothetical protein [Arthrobacter sp. A2-55]